jgi:hypothetical protein
MADIQHSLQISALPAILDPLVSTPSGLSRWWAADVTQAADGAAELGFFNRQTVYRLRLQAYENARRVEWLCETGDEWSGTRLLFAFEGQGAGTLVRFTHAGWRSASPYFISCNTVWGELMFRLKAAAEGGSPGPLFLADRMAR